MILGVHHVQITIPRGAEDEARRFYCGLLGFREVAKPASLAGRGGFWMELAKLQVHVGVEDGFDRLTTKGHVAYAVEDLDAVQRLIEGWGLKPEVGIPIPGYRRFECRDPFGNRVEFIQRVDDA